MITVSELWIYPVKSCRGIRVQEARLDSLGLAGDRRFLVVDDAGMQLTQRVHTKMALVETQLTERDLVLGAPDMPMLTVARHVPGRPIRAA